jgi:hypothetical protein
MTLKASIEDTIKEAHFSVDEVIPKQVSECHQDFEVGKSL